MKFKLEMKPIGHSMVPNAVATQQDNRFEPEPHLHNVDLTLSNNKETKYTVLMGSPVKRNLDLITSAL